MEVSAVTEIIHIFFFNDTATTEIYTLSLHDALPISPRPWTSCSSAHCPTRGSWDGRSAPSSPSSTGGITDRKSTRLNSSHANISYAVFCLKKKNSNLPPCQSSFPNF